MFAEATGRLMAVAALLLGWRPSEFWDATPAELATILRACAGEDGSVGMDADGLARLKEICPDG